MCNGAVLLKIFGIFTVWIKEKADGMGETV